MNYLTVALGSHYDPRASTARGVVLFHRDDVIDEMAWNRECYSLGSSQVISLSQAVNELGRMDKRVFDNIDGIRVLTDSNYLYSAATRWLPRWARTGWKAVGGKRRIANDSMWKLLYDRMLNYDLSFFWAPSHELGYLCERANSMALHGTDPI